MSQSQIDKVTKLKDQASAKFEIAVTASEKIIFDEAVTLISELEKTADGKIKSSVTNLKRLAQIKTKLAKVATNKTYLKAIEELAREFDAIYKAQAVYFSSLTATMYHKKKHQTIKELAIENTIGGLVGAGLQSNVTDKLNDMLLRAVTSGAKFADLVEEMRAHLRGKDGSPGALSRYAGTYTVTALNQYAGQNNKILTDDLKCEWFEYTGSEIETTREFCEHLCAKRWVHKSEIPEILKGHIDGHECKIYSKTELPYGLIEGTTPENFQVNVGGWNCRHQLVPVAKEMVPEYIRAKFEKPQAPNENTKDWDEYMADTTYKREAEQFAQWKANVFPELDLGCLVDKTAKKEDLLNQRRVTFVQLSALQKPFWDTQMRLQRSARKAAKNGMEALAQKAEATIESTKFSTIPKSKSEYLQRISSMQAVIDEIKTATSGKPANKKAAKPAVQTKEVTMDTVRISSTMTKAEIFEKRVKWIQDHLKVTEEDAKRYQEGLDRFTRNDYAEIRSAQAGDIDDPAIKKIADDIEEFISKSAKWAGGTTYRGLYLFDYSDYLQQTIGGFRRAQSTRTPIQMYGMSSWSTEKSIAKEFAFRDGDVHVIFICKNGQPQGTSIDGLSRTIGEHEVLTSNNARWLITRINQVNQTYYEIEVTPC